MQISGLADLGVQWFYAFSIAPLTPAAAAVPKLANLTKNPFTDAPSLPTKRPYEPNDDSGANYIWGNVAQPNKRTRVGMYFSASMCCPLDMGQQSRRVNLGCHHQVIGVIAAILQR